MRVKWFWSLKLIRLCSKYGDVCAVDHVVTRLAAERLTRPPPLTSTGTMQPPEQERLHLVLLRRMRMTAVAVVVDVAQ